MKRNSRTVRKIFTTIATAGITVLALGTHPATAQVAVTPPFEESAYLWTQATDTNNFGSGDWVMYKSWLNTPRLGAEVDPGSWYEWGACTEGYWNNNWGNQQASYGTGVLPNILWGIGSMPYNDPQHSTDQLWQLEAANDATVMQHFVNLGNNIVNWNCKSVIIRLNYEFDGDWNPFASLHTMSGMPNNFIKSWQNAVTTVRNTVKARNPNISVKFLWNPTDSNVKVRSSDYYPGDAYVDYIGFDSYDADFSGVYQSGQTPDVATQQRAWTQSIQPRIQWFADFASAANTLNRNGYIAGRSIPIIAGEWGVWPVVAGGRGAGGDNPSYIQNMYNWMTSHNVAMECYFETHASDGDHQLWPGGYPAPHSGNQSWDAQTPFPNAAAKYRDLFGITYSYGVGAAAIPGTVLAANYDTGGQGLAYNQIINGSQTGGRSDNSSADYGSGIGWTYPGQWYKYTVNVASAGTYSIACTVNDPNGGGTFHLEDKSGRNLTGTLTCSSTGNWNTTGTVTATLTLPAGPQVLKWVQDSSGFNLLSMTFSAGSTAPVFTDGFESGNLNAWSLWAGNNGGASFAQNCGSAQAHSGNWEYTDWSSSPYQLTLYKNITVPNGTHTISAWIKSSGGQPTCQMEVTTNGVEAIVPISASSGWTQISTTVTVTTGVVEIGFYSNALGNQWLNVDDVTVN